ncbi:type II toxin-antitoxin system death-on-curing family toxin [Paenisporosarcina cavernae]|uniref:Type II toxin-antitoxin system death-on-curing family toxin n=1 Tax=Paenisporosarcina cavernae TaxID=2320858 RepID=A0A385YZR2_9BACL|nr:type II toxin-antitoxin system death-on-curing family toxin [Paenisporosarcina cavernae]
MKLLSDEQYLAIHYAIMKKHDDLDQAGIKYLDRFEAMIERPSSHFFGEELYPSVVEKACCIYHSITTTHIFQNGNKRTAFAAFLVFLRMNGFTISLTNKQAEDFTVYLAVDEKFKSNDAVSILVREMEPYIKPLKPDNF